MEIKIVILIIILICLLAALFFLLSKLTNRGLLVLKYNGGGLQIQKFDPKVFWTLKCVKNNLCVVPLTEGINAFGDIVIKNSTDLINIVSEIYTAFFVEVNLSKIANISLALSDKKVDNLYEPLRTYVKNYIEIYKKIFKLAIKESKDMENTILTILDKNKNIPTLLLDNLNNIVNDLYDFYKDVIKSLKDFVIKKIDQSKCLGADTNVNQEIGSQEIEDQLIEDQNIGVKLNNSSSDKFKQGFNKIGQKIKQGFNKFSQKSIKFLEKTKEIVITASLNYLDSHQEEFNEFYKDTLWKNIQALIDKIIKDINIDGLVNRLNGIRLDCILPNINYFIAKFKVGVNKLLNPQVLLELPKNYVSIDEYMKEVELKGSNNSKNIISEIYNNSSLAKPIDENNYGKRLKAYLNNIVVGHFFKELENDLIQLVSLFEPNKLITFFSGLIPGTNCEYYTKLIPDNIMKLLK